MSRAAIVSLAVDFPARHMPNAHWLTHHPAMVEQARRSAEGRVWRAPADDAAGAEFDAAMRPFFHDPFLGAKDRRWLEPGREVLEIEQNAARAALDAAGLVAADIDVCLCGSFFSDRRDVGNAAYLGAALGLRMAINIETACATGIVGVDLARALVVAGQAKRVLVVTSCTYSRIADETSMISWANGDGAVAVVVAADDDDAGILASHTISTPSTNGAVFSRVDPSSPSGLRMEAAPDGGKRIRDVSAPALRACVNGALAAAGKGLDDVDFFAVATPTAWYADFAARALGFPAHKTINTHPLYANTGPVLTLTNLFHALVEQRIRPGHLVVLYAIGSTATASAIVMRAGDIRLGPVPESVPESA